MIVIREKVLPLIKIRTLNLIAMKSLKKLNLNSMQVSKHVASSALDKFFAVADKEIKVTILKR